MGQPATFALLLRQHRRAAGLTQEALAERAGMSARGIQDLERGVSQSPRPATLELLATALDLSSQDRAELLRAAQQVPSPAERSHSLLLSGCDLVPLVGRHAELALLDEFLTPRRGQTSLPPLLLLAGEPGIGKTRLLQSATKQAVARGWTVLTGGCQRRAGQEPYAPLVEALASHLQLRPPARLVSTLEGCAWLVRLLPELAPVLQPVPAGTLQTEQERRLLFAAVARVLSNVAAPAGTLLVLDDLQWAGPDALDLLTALVRNPDVPLRAVGAYRDSDVRPDDPLGLLLGDLAPAGLVRQQTLGPLSEEEAGTLLSDLLMNRTRGADIARELLDRAGGVPFFLISYAQALSTGNGQIIPWDLAQGVRQRVALLPEPARAVLAAAAIAGRHVSRRLIMSAAGQTEDEMLIGLEEVCRARLLMEEGDRGYAFAHDVIREVVEADISSARRAVLHRRVAEALEAGPQPAPPEALAYHFARGDVPDRARAYLEQAGDAAWAQRAAGAAEHHYRDLLHQADMLARRDDARRVREKLANVLYDTGRYDAAIPLLDSIAVELTSTADWVNLVRVTARLGWAHSRRGTADNGIACIEGLLELLNVHGEQPPPALYAALGQLLFGTGRYSQSLMATQRAVEQARAFGNEPARVLADAQLMNILQTAGHVEDALRVSRDVFPAIEPLDDLDALRRAHGDVAYILTLRGDLCAARRHADRAQAVCERTGEPASLAFALTLHAWIDTLAGDWKNAHDYLERALGLIAPVKRSWYSPYPRLFLARLLLAEGAWVAAATAGEEALALAKESGDLQAVRWTAPTIAELEIRQGHPEAAVARLEPLLDRPCLEECDVTSLLPVLAWAHLRAGRVEVAETLVEQAVSRSRQVGMRPTEVEALRVRAIVALQTKRWTQAARDLEEGLAVAQDIPYAYAEAQLLRADAERYRALGEDCRATDRLREALSIFRRLGAQRDAAEVAESLDNAPSGTAPDAAGTHPYRRS